MCQQAAAHTSLGVVAVAARLGLTMRHHGSRGQPRLGAIRTSSTHHRRNNMYTPNIVDVWSTSTNLLTNHATSQPTTTGWFGQIQNKHSNGDMTFELDKYSSRLLLASNTHPLSVVGSVIATCRKDGPAAGQTNMYTYISEHCVCSTLPNAPTHASRSHTHTQRSIIRIRTWLTSIRWADTMTGVRMMAAAIRLGINLIDLT